MKKLWLAILLLLGASACALWAAGVSNGAYGLVIMLGCLCFAWAFVVVYLWADEKEPAPEPLPIKEPAWWEHS